METFLVRHVPINPALVRHELAADLDLFGIAPEAIEEVALVASELLGNAVRHAGAELDNELDVAWTVRPDEIVVSVEDPSAALPVARQAESAATSGRGLTIIAALTTDWGYELTPRGKRVWARIPLYKAS